MKQIIFKIGILFFLCGCVLTGEPTPRPSSPIVESKKDSLFINEYNPQLPYLRIEEKDYKIKETWVEHPHLERKEGRIPCKGYDFIMTFDPYQYPGDRTDLSKYTKNLASDNLRIWFFLEEKDYLKDTLTLYYREKLDSKQLKTFTLIKKPIL